MRTQEIKLYKYDELSKNAQERALNKLCYINVDYEWYEFIYDDAENIGLKITGFDIDRGNYCHGEFKLDCLEVAQNILNEHGENCETHKTAEKFLEKHEPLYSDYLDENSANYESQEIEDQLLDLESEFKNSLLEDYRIMLKNEYEYLTSQEAIKETIIANNYEFTEDGELF